MLSGPTVKINQVVGDFVRVKYGARAIKRGLVLLVECFAHLQSE